MSERPRFFIFNRKEMGVFLVLAVLVSVFAFTLGVHLGKRVSPRGTAPAPSPAAAVGTVEDEIPNTQEFNENAAKVHQAADESLEQAARDEVVRTGVKLDSPRQIELPSRSKFRNGGATTDRVTDRAKAESPMISVPSAQRPTPEGKYTLQIGSYPKQEEAVAHANALEATGLRPYLREAEVKGVGKRFRLYVGGYPSVEAATQAGRQYKNQQMIDSFVVANTP